MKPSYREHYFNLAAEQNRTKILASERNHTKATDDNSAPEKLSDGAAKESNDIGSEECGVNVFEDGTILEDGHREAGGLSSSYAAEQPFPLVEARTGEEEVHEVEVEDKEVEEEVEHGDEGGQEENYEEDKGDESEGERRTDLLEKEKKNDKEEDLVERAMLTKKEDVKEEEDLERQARDPLDMEVSDETGDLFSEEETNLAREQKLLSSNPAETRIERNESAEDASARELAEATMFIADPDRGERERHLGAYFKNKGSPN